MLANTVALGLLTLLRVAVAAPLEPRWSTDLLGESCKRKLTFGKDGHFKVVSFSDLHYGERDGDNWVAWGPEQDVNTTKVQASILDYEKPNYVLYNGDLVTGEGLLKDNATVYLDQCFSEAVKRNIPFSSSHGNHDNSFNITHQQEINYETQIYGGFNGLSYTRSDVGPKPYGSGNYWVPVYARPHDRVPALVIWIFDSRSFVPGGSETEGAKSWVDPQTVPPYIYSQGDLMKRRWGSIPPSLVYVHIPLQKSQIVANLTGLIGNKDDDPNPAAQGFQDTDYTGLDLPFFDALVWLDQKKGNVLAVTSGHDHGDSWCGKIQTSGGLTLCFNGHAGYGGYTTKNSQVRNGRVFDLTLADLRKSRPTVKTYNSYEDQTRNEFVELGPKFGKK